MAQVSLATLLVLLLQVAACVLAQSQLLFNHASTGTYANTSATCAPPILNQGQCGCCYAFSASLTFGTTACLQTKTQTLQRLSPQFSLGVMYVNADQSDGHDPCDGGVPCQVMSYLSEQSGIGLCQDACTSGCLPFAEASCVENTADYSCPSFDTTSCDQGYSLHALAPNTMQAQYLGQGQTLTQLQASVQSWLVNNGPVSIAIDACQDFMNYWNSLTPSSPTAFNGNCPGTINHAVTIVGWVYPAAVTTAAPPSTNAPQSTSSNNFDVMLEEVGGQAGASVGASAGASTGAPAGDDLWWIVQNSWGETGDSGFFYLSANALAAGSDASGYITVGEISGASLSQGPTAVPAGMCTSASDEEALMGRWFDVERTHTSVEHATDLFNRAFNDAKVSRVSTTHVHQRAQGAFHSVGSPIVASDILHARRKVVAGSLFNITHVTTHEDKSTTRWNMQMYCDLNGDYSVLNAVATSSSSSPSSSSPNAGLIAGSVVGGVAVLTIIVGVALYMKAAAAGAALPHGADMDVQLLDIEAE